MTRFVLLLILSVVVARVFWRVVDGVVEGLTGRPGSTPVFFRRYSTGVRPQK